MAEIQKAAAAVVAESRSNCSEMTKSFAKLGCSGKFPGNVERDLMRLLELPLDAGPRYSSGNPNNPKP